MDRNILKEGGAFAPPLVARRAWIEIASDMRSFGGADVALRKESVDRNGIVAYFCSIRFWSLSARRAWIEIAGQGCWQIAFCRRSPQGERG